ncbi:MAG: glycosyltransferase [Candidatus Omnitrophica bacterium]|nr:glycosyltransferase [Candidatus Omnitrophota bacterium]MDD5538433.1 glycosyltransferase [Candidatus Omnitrophota bacterium]
MLSGKKVLILYITERSGHHSAASALKRGFEVVDPSVTVRCINAFRYFFPVTEWLTHKVYLFVIKRVPSIWRFLYDRPSFVKKSDGFKTWLHRRAFDKLERLLREFSPDAVMCTQAFPCGILSAYKRERGGRFKLYGVLTDFAPHSFWVYDEVDFYVVASEQTRTELSRKGVSPDKIRVLGIPIDPKFSKHINAVDVRAQYGLDKDIPVVLVMGGGHGLGPIKQIIKELDECEMPMQMMVVCGLNRKLYRWMVNRRFQKRVLTFKYSNEIEQLMSAANLVITKPGGITTAESLAKGLPMVILNPIPGQEARNTDFLVDARAALSAASVLDVVPAVRCILAGNAAGPEMVSHTKGSSLAKATSSLDIATFVLSNE